MSQQTPAYVISASSHGAALFRQAFAAGFGTGGGVFGQGEYKVTQQASPNMSVLVAAGRACVPGTQQSAPSGFSWTQQGAYFGLNDGPVTLTISAADPSNPRIDVVYLAVQDAFYSGATNQIVLGVVTGTPSGSPVAPGVPANAIALANVAVAANATSIVNANVTDKRAFVSDPLAQGVFTNEAAAGTQPLGTIVYLTAPTTANWVAGPYISNGAGGWAPLSVESTTGPPNSCRYYRNAAQNVAGSGGATDVIWDTSVFDNHTGGSGHINTGTGVFTAGAAGLYVIKWQLMISAANAAGDYYTQLTDTSNNVLGYGSGELIRGMTLGDRMTSIGMVPIVLGAGAQVKIRGVWTGATASAIVTGVQSDFAAWLVH